MKVLLTIALVAGAATAVAPAYAKTDDGVPTREVGYSDLKLHTTEGQRILKKRVKLAAAQVCGEKSDIITIGTPNYFCSISVYQAARPQMKAAFDRARNGTVELTSAQKAISVSGGL